MTTIAFRDGIMASDSQATDDYLSLDTSKVHKVKFYKNPDAKKKTSALVGLSGVLEDCLIFIDHYYGIDSQLANGSDPKGIFKDLDVWGLIYEEEVLYQVAPRRPIPLEGKFHATGSGGVFAQAAMMAGATAKEAVEIAKELDPYTGGKVQVLKL